MRNLVVGDVFKTGSITLTVTAIELHADMLGSDDLDRWYTLVRYTWRNAETGETYDTDAPAADLLRDLRKHGLI